MTYMRIGNRSRWLATSKDIVAAIHNHRDGCKAVIDFGTEALSEIGWLAGKTKLDIFIGSGNDTGIIRVSKGSDFQLRKRPTKPGGRLIFRASAVNVEHKMPARKVTYMKDAEGRMFINIASLLKGEG